MRLPRLYLRWVFAAGLIVCSHVQAQTVQLIKDDEARLPAASAAPPSRAITRGPGVKLTSPEAVSGAFGFKVQFEPRGGSKIDPASVKVEYLKNPVVDITERVKAGVKPEGIDLAAVAAPAGEHPIRVTVRDTEGRVGSATFSLKVK